MRPLYALCALTILLATQLLQASDTGEPNSALPLAAANASDLSYECDAADGEVFYQHLPCPDTLPANSADCSRRVPCDANAAPVPVVSTQIPREQACREINRAGAIGRKGHERDAIASTYDKNLGRDPCR